MREQPSNYWDCCKSLLGEAQLPGEYLHGFGVCVGEDGHLLHLWSLVSDEEREYRPLLWRMVIVDSSIYLCLLRLEPRSACLFIFFRKVFVRFLTENIHFSSSVLSGVHNFSSSPEYINRLISVHFEVYVIHWL